MASEIVGEEKEQEKEPSIYSSDPNERKLARRLRIQRRLEAAEKLQAIADGTYTEPEPEKPLIDDVIETCEDTLRQLKLEGNELVTNVIVASDASEVQRREIEAEEKRIRLEKLKDESLFALEKLNEISSKWEAIMDTSGPLELHQHAKDQKAKCLELIEQKNDLIKGFQMELKMADEKFMKDRKSMYEELALLTKRIDEQVLVMKRAYRIELHHVEESVDETRAQIIEKHNKIWQSLYNQREKDETTNMERKFNMVEGFHDELRKLHTDHEEKFRETRIQLETDIQTLEQELEQVKALCLLNSEKLDYNYQVLKKREEENVYIKNHQKRRLNKLQDLVNTLKKKTDEKRLATDEEFKRLTSEVKRYHANVLDTENKADHFAKVNDEKFQNIWDMKDEEAKDLMDKIHSADMVIHEQILGLTWTPPAITTVNKMDIPSFKAAKTLVKEISYTLTMDPLSSKDLRENDNAPEVLEGHRRLLCHILHLIADTTGFLMEEKLDELLKPYTEDEKTFVRLDNVFMAIGINTEEDLKTMKKVFLPHTVCLLCEGNPSLFSVGARTEFPASDAATDVATTYTVQNEELGENMSKSKTQTKDESYENDDSSMDGSKPTFDYNSDKEESQDHKLEKESQDHKKDHASTSTKRENKQSLKDSREAFQGSRHRTSTSQNLSQCDITHPLVIEKHNVLKALRDFVSRFHSTRNRTLSGLSSKLNRKRLTVSRFLTLDDITTYWNKYYELLPFKVESIWHGIFLALTRYLTILQERHELNLKAQAIRRQNVELKRLLAFYRTGSNKGINLPVISTVPDEPINPEVLEKIAQKLVL